MSHSETSALAANKVLKGHDFINPKVHIRQRIALALLFTIYLSGVEQNIWFIDSRPLTLTVAAIYLGLSSITHWIYQRFNNDIRVTQTYIAADLIFASYCIIQDPSAISLGLIYLFVTAISNGCQHGLYLYRTTLIYTLALALFSSACQFALSNRYPTTGWLIEVSLLVISTYAINFFYFQLNEIQSHIAKDQELDPMTGLLHKDAFEHAAHIAMELRVKNPNNLIFMLIEVDRLQTDSPSKELKNRHISREAIRHFARLVHINLKPNDIIGRYDGNIFSLMLNQSDKDSAIAAGLALQHEFALWSEGHSSQKLHLNIAITTLPNFYVPTITLYEHTAKGLVQAAKRRGSPGIITVRELVSQDIVAGNRSGT